MRVEEIQLATRIQRHRDRTGPQANIGQPNNGSPSCVDGIVGLACGLRSIIYVSLDESGCDPGLSRKISGGGYRSRRKIETSHQRATTSQRQSIEPDMAL